MAFNKTKKGFTLIELAMVIAIIGLLVGIIITLLQGSKIRGKDGAIIAEMDQIRKGAEVYRSYQGDIYTGLSCSVATPVDINRLCTDIDNQNGNNGSTPTFNVASDRYCAYVGMATASKWFCISSIQGRAVFTSTNPSVSACTGSSYNCP